VSESPLVTILLPIRNEAGFIERSLRAILDQDYPAARLEILVLDGMSEDGTRDMVQEMLAGVPFAKMLDNPRLLASAALNIGLAEASGEVIVRVDGHTIIAPDYVRRCVEVLSATGADCVGGLMQAEGTTPMGAAIALATSSPFGIGGSRFHFSAQPQETETVYLGAWPTQVLRSRGAFQEDVGCNEDDEFNYRLRADGRRIWLDPSIRSVYYCRPDLGSLWHQYFRYGFWKVRVFQKVPGSAQLRHWAPPLFALAMAGGLLAALLFPFLRPLYVAGLGLYLLADLIVSVTIAARAGWRHLLRLFVVFPSLHLAYGFGFWAGILRFGPPWWRTRSITPAGSAGRG
jgi:glycosyltransferase involved in cell wall biosynthesis